MNTPHISHDISQNNMNIGELLAGLNLRTFPLPKGSKAANTRNFYEKASVDSSLDFEFNNYAVATGAGVLVLDFDTKPDVGIDGIAHLKAFDLLGLPHSFRVRSPNGVHVYLTVPSELLVRSAHNLKWIDGTKMLGVDVRGHHAYVVAPGSVVDGKKYEPIHPVPAKIDPAPEFVLKLLAGAREHDVDNGLPVVDPDQPHMVKRAIDYLVNEAPTAVLHDGSDETTLKVGYRLRDLGISQARALELMHTFLVCDKTSPRFDNEYVQQKVANSYAYASHRIGEHDATAEFKALPQEDLDRIGSTLPNPESSSASVSSLLAPPFRSWQVIDFSKIPKRRILYSNHYIGRFMSTTVAPGGLGKSSLVIAEAVSMATGNDFLGQGLPEGRLKVAYHNAEDEIDEIERRVAAICQHHRVDQSLLVGHFFISSGREDPKLLFTEGEAGAINGEAFGRIEAWARGVAADVLIFDPLANMTTSPETNEVFRALGARLSKMAGRLNCAVEIVHHTRKLNGNEATVEDGRGGSALLAAARAGRVLNPMTAEEAGKAGLASHRDHFRVEADGKNNLMRALPQARWFVRENVHVPSGENVGAVAKWDWPDASEELSKGVVREILVRVREAGNRCRYDQRAAGWVGHIVAEAMGLSTEDAGEKARSKGALDTLYKWGTLKQKTVWDERQGREIRVVVAGDGSSFYENEDE